MRQAQLSISALPAWSKLNDIIFHDISVREIEGKGFGLVADRHLGSEDAFDMPALLRVPKDLILSREAIDEHALVDKDFRELLNAAGAVSLRGDILLFLLMQITIATADKVGVSGAFCEYVKLLPSYLPVPTAWTEEERTLLTGTSLELPLKAKISALRREYERLRQLTEGISWCRRLWWESGGLTFGDWVRLDSWYRSRCLEFPDSGESMVPCLDMVNHARDANAYYEKTTSGDVVLLLRPSEKVEPGGEITISYGSSKSAAEMLFSYGFVDELIETDSLVLDLHPLRDDPLGKAKVAAFSGRPVVRISLEAATVQWSSPFLYLMCMNEEDGLEFKVLQQIDGSESRLQVFLQEVDITDSTANIEEHITQHPLRDILSLRAVSTLQDRLQKQLVRLYASEEMSTINEASLIDIDGRISISASQLRHRETTLLETAFNALDIQKFTLIESPVVVAYFGSRQPASDDNEGGGNADKDFS